MYEIEKTERVKELIAVTKSDSGISGPELCAAHMELGRILADGLRELDPDDTTVIAMLRGGIFFAEGIYFALRCRFETFDRRSKIYWTRICMWPVASSTRMRLRSSKTGFIRSGCPRTHSSVPV